MEFDEMKNSSFDSSSLEEIQPLLEELEEKVAESTESQSDTSFSNGILSEKTSVVTSKTSVVSTRKIIRESIMEEPPVADEKKDVELIDTPQDSSKNETVENTVEETPDLDNSLVLADDIVLDDEAVIANEVENNFISNVSNSVSSTTTNTTSTTNTTNTTNNMTNMTQSVFDTVNSNVNIDTNTINVSATNVVVSGLNDKDDSTKESSDYSHINSYKGSLELSTDENVIREYRITKAGGKAIVTNKRFVVDCKTRLDLPIEKVGGIASSRRLVIKTASLIFGIIFLVLCAVCEFFGNSAMIPFAWAQYLLMAVGGVLGLIGLIMVICAFQNKFTLNIFGDGLYSVMVVSRNTREAKESLQGITIEERKGKDFAKFTGEIGAILVQAKEDLKRK